MKSKYARQEMMDEPALISCENLPNTKTMALDSDRICRLDGLLRMAAIQVCSSHNMSFGSVHPVSRMFMTHYKCMICGLRPLYCLNLKSLNKVRCGICGNGVCLNNSGKHGRMRKMIAISLHESLGYLPRI